ncbi:MAG: hypothetical protein N2D54_01645, partial [Chloroflexota bacterium]
LLFSSEEDITKMVLRLEEIEGVDAVEVGLPVDITPAQAASACSAAVGELPVIIRLPLSQAANLAQSCMQAGAQIISLGPDRGEQPNAQGEIISGRLYGPSQYPKALQTVKQIAELGVPVIGAGGVYTQPEANKILAAGASAVQLDTVLWRSGLPE